MLAISPVRENMDGVESLAASLPASDPAGRSLRDYAEYHVPGAGYTQRCPGAGIIDLYTTNDFISIDLPVEKAMNPGEELCRVAAGNAASGGNSIIIECESGKSNGYPLGKHVILKGKQNRWGK